MQEWTLFYSLYWIAVYFAVLGISVYGYLRLPKQSSSSIDFKPLIRYLCVSTFALAAFLLIWNLGGYLSGAKTFSSIAADGWQAVTRLGPVWLQITILSLMIFSVWSIFGAKLFRFAKYAVVALILFVSIGGNLNLLDNVPDSAQVAAFPAGAKADYLQRFLDRAGHQPKLFVSDLPYANAYVKGGGTEEVYFTQRAVQSLDEKDLLGNLAHELGHIYEPHLAIQLRNHMRPLVITGGVLFLLTALGLLAWCMQSPAMAEKCGFMLKEGDKEGNRLAIIEIGRVFPRELAHVALLVIALWLPSLMLDNYLGKIEELNADRAGREMLEKYDYPAEIGAHGLRQMVRANFGGGIDYHWLYNSCFSDHPATSERLALMGTAPE